MKKVIFQKKAVGLFRMAREAVERRAVRSTGVRPEVAALIERNMKERPDIWQSLADSPTPMKSPK